ncbi:unnamed protein product [Paramecium pentaurelia]|uniref:Uncharacterized protein n=1 Tax=Paramecium pentaurelia TaxID=43138 RepID=A0A8S1UFG4_9CILI|nr:unnamed protein product [Paramecium pentaurelia]
MILDQKLKIFLIKLDNIRIMLMIQLIKEFQQMFLIISILIFKVKVQILETLTSFLDLIRAEKKNKQIHIGIDRFILEGQQQFSSFRDKFIGFLKHGE